MALKRGQRDNKANEVWNEMNERLILFGSKHSISYRQLDHEFILKSILMIFCYRLRFFKDDDLENRFG